MNIKKASCLLAGFVSFASMSNSANAQNFDIHRFCMAVADSDCLNWQAMGYTDHTACAIVMYERCLQDVGWPGGGGGDIFGPEFPKVCVVPGKIGAWKYC